MIEANREPAPVGALFEAAFRRFGAHLMAYLLWSTAVGSVAILLGLVARTIENGRLAFGVFFAGVALSHFLLTGVLTALVTATLRSRAAQLVAASLVSALVMFGGALAVGPLVGIVYPVLVFAPIAAAAGDAGALGAFPLAARLTVRDWGRAYSALLGLGVCFFFLWFGFTVSLTPIGGSARQVVVMVLTILIGSPIAALVERNLYGDLTGRNVLPAAVSRERRPQPQPRSGRPARRWRRSDRD